MARLSSLITFTGPLSDFSAYRMRGVDGIVFRKKGGPSRKQIHKGKAFKLVRLNLAEFGGCASATRVMRRVFYRLNALADYNFTGKLNARFKQVQLHDTINERGTRSVALSQHVDVLRNFSWNREHLLESVLRFTPVVELSRSTRSAEVIIPALTPGINFRPTHAHSHYSLVIELAILPDMIYCTKQKRYKPSLSEDILAAASVETPWQPVNTRSTEAAFCLLNTNVADNNAFTLVLAMGVRYGAIAEDGTVQQVKRAGCASVIATG